MIKPLVKKTQLDPTELVNYRPIPEKAESSQLCAPFWGKKKKKMVLQGFSVRI